MCQRYNLAVIYASYDSQIVSLTHLIGVLGVSEKISRRWTGFLHKGGAYNNFHKKCYKKPFTEVQNFFYNHLHDTLYLHHLKSHYHWHYIREVYNNIIYIYVYTYIYIYIYIFIHIHMYTYTYIYVYLHHLKSHYRLRCIRGIIILIYVHTYDTHMFNVDIYTYTYIHVCIPPSSESLSLALHKGGISSSSCLIAS
jgi:hypothetical protein